MFLGKLVKLRKAKEWLEWEERTTVSEEEQKEAKKREQRKRERPLTLKNGTLVEAKEEDEKLFFSRDRAEALMRRGSLGWCVGRRLYLFVTGFQPRD